MLSCETRVSRLFFCKPNSASGKRYLKDNFPLDCGKQEVAMRLSVNMLALMLASSGT